MSVRAFGEKAHRVAKRLSGDEPVLICEPAHAAAALSAAVEARRRGEHFSAWVVWEDERTRLARTTSAALCTRYATWDEVRLMLHDFADGLDPHVSYPISAADRASLHECIRLSDGLIVSSHAERTRIEAGIGTIPAEVDVVVPDLAPLAVVPAAATDIVVYAPDESGAGLGTFVTALGDFTSPVTIVARDAPALPGRVNFVTPLQAGTALGRARVIVDGSNDPGTARTLAALGRPLAVSACSGATELLRNVAAFEPWHRPSIVAAVADALAGNAPEFREAPRSTPRALRPAAPIGPNPPLVSVIVTTYNRRVRLADTLATIEGQTYPALEIVVVNDAGTDVRDVVARFPRARLIERAQNGGPAAARNTGLRAARGAFALFFDDDDEMFPEHVAVLAGALERSGLDVAYGQMINGFATTGADGHDELSGVLAHYALLDRAEIQWGGSLATTAVMFRRRLVEEIGELDESLGANEDFEFWIRLAAGRDWARVADVTSIYYVRTDGSNRSNQNTRARYLLAHRAIFAKHPSTRELVNAGRTAMLELFSCP